MTPPVAIKHDLCGSKKEMGALCVSCELSKVTTRSRPFSLSNGSCSYQPVVNKNVNSEKETEREKKQVVHHRASS